MKLLRNIYRFIAGFLFLFMLIGATANVQRDEFSLSMGVLVMLIVAVVVSVPELAIRFFSRK